MVAITSAIMFATLQSYAEPGDGTGDGGGQSTDTTVENPAKEENAKQIKLDYPLGNMESWLAEADKYALNPINIRAGKHPDREDPNGGAYDVVYIFPTEALANEWWNGVGSPPDEIPDDAVAFIHWELDNGSGAFPGIMSKADIAGFKSKNCIMAAGATIPMPGIKDGIEKTCNNPQGSSKRFKMNVLKADEPIDLVYNVVTAPLTYTNYDAVEDGLPTYNIPDDNPDLGPITESGRIYRVLQKWHNATATNTANGVDNPGNRIVSFSLELGYGIGGAFTPINQDNGDGLDPDKALGFELRPCMADHFFDVRRDSKSTGTNPCSESYDGTNDPLVDQILRQEIWLEEEYSTFSPKMYSLNTDKRTTPVGGWWDKRPAGIYPPQLQTKGKLDSGTVDTSNYYPDANPDRVDGGEVNTIDSYQGATTSNYFNIVGAQAQSYVPADPLTIDTNGEIDQPVPFGYLMHFGVLSHGDYGIVSRGVYMDEDGDPSSEGDLVAWWDGDEYRWGSDPTYDGEINDDGFAIVPRETLVEWGLFPLQEEPDPVTGEFPAGPLYEIGVMDDLAGLNVDSFVYLGRNFNNDTTNSGHTNFTIRLTAVSVEKGLGYSGGETGNEPPPWVTKPPKDLVGYINRDGVIAIRADFAGKPIVVSLGDLLVGEAPTAVVENLRTGEKETITLESDDNEQSIMWKTLKVGTQLMDETLQKWKRDALKLKVQKQIGKQYKMNEFNPAAILNVKLMVESGELRSELESTLGKQS